MLVLDHTMGYAEAVAAAVTGAVTGAQAVTGECTQLQRALLAAHHQGRGLQSQLQELGARLAAQAAEAVEAEAAAVECAVSEERRRHQEQARSLLPFQVSLTAQLQVTGRTFCACSQQSHFAPNHVDLQELLATSTREPHGGWATQAEQAGAEAAAARAEQQRLQDALAGAAAEVGELQQQVLAAAVEADRAHAERAALAAGAATAAQREAAALGELAAVRRRLSQVHPRHEWRLLQLL